MGKLGEQVAHLRAHGWFTRPHDSGWYLTRRGSTLMTTFDEACLIQKRRDAASKGRHSGPEARVGAQETERLRAALARIAKPMTSEEDGVRLCDTCLRRIDPHDSVAMDCADPCPGFIARAALSPPTPQDGQPGRPTPAAPSDAVERARAERDATLAIGHRAGKAGGLRLALEAVRARSWSEPVEGCIRAIERVAGMAGAGMAEPAPCGTCGGRGEAAERARAEAYKEALRLARQLIVDQGCASMELGCDDRPCAKLRYILLGIDERLAAAPPVAGAR